MSKKLWTEEELNYLKNNYLIKSGNEIAEYLGRSRQSIQIKAKREGLSKTSRWSTEEEEFLSKYYISHGIKYCSKSLGRSEASICHRAKSLGLKIYDKEFFSSIMQEWLEENSEFSLLEEFTNTNEKLLVKHKNCDYKWKVRLNDLKANRKAGNTGCPRCASNRKYSQIAIQWLKSLNNPNIQHAENGGEVSFGKYKVDGYESVTNTIYEFHGDAYHGNLDLYSPDFRCHPFDKSKTAEELWQATYERMEVLSKQSTVIFIWQNDYIRGKEYSVFNNI